MNIIICGAGRVGFTIAKQLSEQGHSITVIDPSSEDIQKIDDALDVKAIVGKGTYPSILEKANAAETGMIIAVTRNDEINMLICQIAFSIFKIPKKIARIRSQDYLNPKFTRVYNKENLPIDVIISPEIEIAKSIQRKLEAPGALDSVPFADNKIRLLEILINENCKLINIKLNDLTKKHPNLDANIIGIIRDEKFLIPKKNDDVKKNDKFLLWESLHHIGGIEVILLSLLHDIQIVLLKKFSATNFWNQIRGNKITKIHYLGGILDILLKLPKKKSDRKNNVKLAFGAGAREETYSIFRKRFNLPLREVYGMTEASSFSTINFKNRIGSIGQTVPWFKINLSNIEKGIGEIVEPLDLNTDLDLLIAVPKVGLSTKDVFDSFDTFDSKNRDTDTWNEIGIFNDLWPAATEVYPELVSLRDGLQEKYQNKL